MQYSIDFLKSVLNGLNHCWTRLIDGYSFRFPLQKCISVWWAHRRGKLSPHEYQLMALTFECPCARIDVCFCLFLEELRVKIWVRLGKS